MRASRCHFTRSGKFVGSMPVERSRASIHCSSVKARRPCEQLLQVHVRHLDRLQVPQDERRALLVLLVEVLQRDDAPDAADQQLLELLDDAAGDLDPFDAQVGQQRLVHVPLFVERHRHLVDDLQAAPLPDRGLDLLGLVGPDVVLGQDLLDRRRPSWITASSFEAQ